MLFPQSEYGRVAQLGERTVRIRKVEGSIPFESTKGALQNVLNKKTHRSAPKGVGRCVFLLYN